ncbi:hypothetical protein JYU14_00970 [Simkania negevensis]|uniref:Protein kinase domain-containing protein n=1 Tax=Simkania negevensis TaxID=83561 RepID=A0ABS3ARA6_9BACT|nr:hypothetical protein [Simkania negevensis]
MNPTTDSPATFQEIHCTDASREKIVRLISSLQQCASPFITKIHSVSYKNNTCEITYEATFGASFSRYLKRIPYPLTDEEWNDYKVYLVELLLAFEELEKNHITNIDINPTDLSITKESHLKVLRFSLFLPNPNALTHSFGKIAYRLLTGKDLITTPKLTLPEDFLELDQDLQHLLLFIFGFRHTPPSIKDLKKCLLFEDINWKNPPQPRRRPTTEISKQLLHVLIDVDEGDRQSDAAPAAASAPTESAATSTLTTSPGLTPSTGPRLNVLAGDTTTAAQAVIVAQTVLLQQSKKDVTCSCTPSGCVIS